MSTPAFTITQGEKFGAVVLNHAGRRGDLAQPIHLGDDLWVLPETPLEMQQHWQEWLGSIRSNAVREANLWLVAKAPSQEPGVDNDENRREIERATRILYALLLVTPIYYEQGFFLSGANVSGQSEVRQFGDLDHFRVTETPNASVGSADVTQAQSILTAFSEIFNGGPFSRVRAGIVVFLRGLRREHIDGRLHQFARSLEGVVKPDIGKSKSQFIHRCQTFTGASPANAEILSESYDIRSQVEHLHDWQNALPALSQDLREERLKSHQRRIEALCRHVYGRITTSPGHRAVFQDESIDGFWQRPDHERTTAWGPPLNLAALK